MIELYVYTTRFEVTEFMFWKGLFHSWTKKTKKDAPHNYLGEVHEYLNTHFASRWIGKAALMAWPPRSPDLTPLDSLLCGFVNHNHPR
jgi:hypothetical protein